MSDATARLRAQTEFAAPLLVEAGAGTGKTAVLVARVVAWCLGPGWLEHAAAGGSHDAIARAVLLRVVAITFTEAAAAEMATRIADALRQIALGEQPIGVAAEALPAAGEELAKRASALRGALDHLTVRTIHAFCRRLLASHPLDAGLHPQLTVDADQQQAALAAREVLEASLLEAFSGGGDGGAYAQLAAARIGPADLENALVELLGEGAHERDLDAAAIAPAAYAQLGRELADALAALRLAERGRFARAKQVATAQKVMECAEQLGAWLAEGPLSEARLAVAPGDQLAPEDVRRRVREWATNGPGTMETKALGDACEPVAEAARALSPLLDHLARSSPPAIAAARSLLAQLLGDARAKLRERGVATYGALLRDARELLERPEVCASVRASIDQLLVDEFQDTDETQCALLAALGFGEGPRPTLFVVGDPKQSIYGWRNADLAAYDAFKERLVREGGAVLRLVVSHRSVAPVLDEVARAIAPIMRPQRGLQAQFEALEVCERRRGEPGFTDRERAAVEHWLGSEQNAKGEWEAPETREQSEREARALASDLVRLRRESALRFGDVGILLRATTELPVVLDALREAGVPFVVERETAFYQRREVIDALAWIRCAIDPHDQLALVTTLRSASVGVPDAALVALLKRCEIGLIGRIGRDPDALPAAHAKLALAAQEAPAGVPGLDALAGWPHSVARFFDDLAALREAFATLPADRFVEELRTRSGIEAAEAGRRLGAHRVATLDRIFRDLVDWADALHGSPSLLLNALRRSGGEAREQEEGRPTSLADDAVRVLTVHKAKGLDFAHVYLLQLHRGDGGNPKPKPTHVWRLREEPAYQLLGLATPGAWRALARAKQREAEERIRLLYVAMTRAKDRLVLSWCPSGEAEEPPAAKTIGDLLEHRRGRPPLERIAAGDQPSDAGAVRWRHTARLAQIAAPPLGAAPARLPLDPAQMAREDEELRVAREAAQRRAARPVQRVASELTHDDEARADRALPDEDAPQPPRERPDPARRIALAAGSAVHAALELANFASDAEALAAHGEREIARVFAQLEGSEEHRAAQRRAREIWRAACAGPLLSRLRALAPRIRARELPVLLAPDELPASDDAPVGFVSGAIDLLYEDERGLVVADYKTDAARSAAELAELATRYAPQGDAYTRAVQRALGLERRPRFELWFLQAGEVREV
jgi:ATP-dependent helicase/nuclease subunit A